MFDMRSNDEAEGERMTIGETLLWREEPVIGLGIETVPGSGFAPGFPGCCPLRLLRPKNVSASLRTWEKSCLRENKRMT